VCNRTRNEHFACVEQAAKLNFAAVALTTAVKVKVIHKGTHKIPSVIISSLVLHHVAKYLKDNLPTNDDEVEDLFQENDDLEEDVEENQREITAKKT
jgi:hypothetical protein